MSKWKRHSMSIWPAILVRYFFYKMSGQRFHVHVLNYNSGQEVEVRSANDIRYKCDGGCPRHGVADGRLGIFCKALGAVHELIECHPVTSAQLQVHLEADLESSLPSCISLAQPTVNESLGTIGDDIVSHISDTSHTLERSSHLIIYKWRVVENPDSIFAVNPKVDGFLVMWYMHCVL